MNRNHRHHQPHPISIAATTGTGRSLVHPRLAVAVILAFQIALTVIFLLAGMA